MTTQPVDLCIDPIAKHYSYNGEASLLKELELADRHTTLMPVTNVSEALLDNKGYLPNGYRYSRWALSQLCMTLCTGLYPYIKEMTGADREPSQPISDFSFDDARTTFNNVAMRRFQTRLCGRLFLRNTRDKTVDGLLTAKYKWLSNLDMYNHVKSSLE